MLGSKFIIWNFLCDILVRKKIRNQFGGNLQAFELPIGSVIVAVRGTKHSLPTNYINDDGQPIDSIESIEFISSDGTTYGPYGGSGGTAWDETLEEGTSVLFISGYADTVLEGIGFYHST